MTLISSEDIPYGLAIATYFKIVKETLRFVRQACFVKNHKIHEKKFFPVKVKWFCHLKIWKFFYRPCQLIKEKEK